MKLQEGEKTPHFKLRGIDAQGHERDFRLEDLMGENGVVVYFYPKDDTPGCSHEAISFKDHYDEFTSLGVGIVGISPDPIVSHVRFQAKYAIPFPLLSDLDKQTAKAWGAYGEKKRFGKVSEGIIRSSFLLGPDGIAQRVWRNVKVEGHVAQILKTLGS
jgi:peroxiredoxin Q/BCP